MVRKTIYIGFLRSAASRTWVQAPICPRQVHIAASRHRTFRRSPKSQHCREHEFTRANGILDLFEKSSFTNNAQVHPWAFNEQHNEKEIT